MTRRPLLIAAPLLLLPFLCPQTAGAQSLNEVRAQAHQIAGEIAAQRSAGSFNVAAQQRAVDRLGKLALMYIELSDHAAYAGGETREREALSSAYDAVTNPLDDIYDRNSANLERMVKQVMDEDGDLEALYETQPFKEGQVVASQSLYFLNWLHYYGARLHEGAKRKELLEKAQRGFSEFAVGDRRTDLLTESLLGRGLCNVELGNLEYGIHDLQAVVSDPQVSAERKAKARLALLDTYARSGKIDEVLRVSDQVLGTGSHAEDNLVRFIRIRALLAAVKTSGGAQADAYRQQALRLMDQLRKAGGGWEEKVAALAQTGIDNPAQWSAGANNPFAQWELAKMLVQKGDYKQATPLLERFVTSSDPEARQHAGEAQYFLGLASFQAGQYQDAATHLDAALKQPNAAYGADAAYLRFKAMEAIVAKDPKAGGQAYEQAIRSYLTKYPDHKSAFEAQFRLGELLQAQHQCADAVQAYAKVKGDSAFELRAQFATMQCDFETLQTLDQHSARPRRDALIQQIGTELQRFDTLTAEYQKRKGSNDQVPLTDMHAKAAVMRAVYQTVQPEPSDQAIVDALAGFEKKYPEQVDLLPQVARLRLAAYQHLGRFAEAEAEVKARGALVLASAGPQTIEDLAVAFIRDGARRNGKGDAAANQAAQQVALRLYELLLSDTEGTSKTKLTLARLYENTGETDKAVGLYTEVLKSDANSLAAIRGLARGAEAQHRLPDAMTYWQQLSKAVRPGDVPWYEGNYEIARLHRAMGKTSQACDVLDQMKPAMPGLSDADLRKKLDTLYQQTCR